MKTFVLIISKTFPKEHPNSGKPTNFRESILSGTKIHTIRSNIKYWKNIIDKVNSGEAVLSIREWSGKPYKSKQKEIMQLTNPSYQIIEINGWYWRIDGVRRWQRGAVMTVIKNDGLSPYDFTNWFPKIPFVGILIHFTEKRYKWSGGRKSV